MAIRWRRRGIVTEYILPYFETAAPQGKDREVCLVKNVRNKYAQLFRAHYTSLAKLVETTHNDLRLAVEGCLVELFRVSLTILRWEFEIMRLGCTNSRFR